MLTGELRKQIDLIGVSAGWRSPDAIEGESRDTRRKPSDVRVPVQWLWNQPLTRPKRGERWPPFLPYSVFSTSRRSSFARCGVLGERGDGKDLNARVLHLAPDLYPRTPLPADARSDRQYRSDRWQRERSQWSAGNRCGSGHRQRGHARRAHTHDRCPGKFLRPIPAAWQL